jgi:hypothetical protein
MSKLTTIIAGTLIVAGAASAGHIAGKYQVLIEDSKERGMAFAPTIQRIVCGDATDYSSEVAYMLESYVEGYGEERNQQYIFTQMSPDSNMLLAEVGFEYLSQTQKKKVIEIMRAQIKYNEQQGEE